MGKTLYLECSAGISGDMSVAALLDLGADESALRAALASLPAKGFSIRTSRVKKSGLDACDFDVVLDAAHENHDHDMAYLYGTPDQAAACEHDHGHDHEEIHDHPGEPEHSHDHAHPHGHHDGHDRTHDNPHDHEHQHAYNHHEHRSLTDVFAVVDAADITPGARSVAHRVFDVLADAEAAAHGVPRDEVHFHEVGAIDSIVDVVAFAVCFDDLGIDEVVVRELCEGEGSVRCQHGIMPVPVPAVANIVSANGIPLRIVDVQGELVTPTGAAIAAAVRTRADLPERFIIKRVGLGAGKRDYATSGVLRAMLIEEA